MPVCALPMFTDLKLSSNDGAEKLDLHVRVGAIHENLHLIAILAGRADVIDVAKQVMRACFYRRVGVARPEQLADISSLPRSAQMCAHSAANSHTVSAATEARVKRRMVLVSISGPLPK